MNKKKYLSILSIFSLVLLFILSGTCYANWSAGEFERVGLQASKCYYDDHPNSLVYTWFSNFINSNAYQQYKDQIPFDQYDSMFIRYGTGSKVGIFLFSNNATFTVDSSGYFISNNTFTFGYTIFFTCDTRYWSFAFESINLNYTINANAKALSIYLDNGVAHNVGGVMPFTNNTITNQ